jgi:transcriptional regulator with XRE-family HTH domain
MVKIGKKLKELRDAKGYSQDNLAHELNIGQSYYSKMESDHQSPSPEIIEKLAAFYEITPQELIATDGSAQIQYNHESPHAVNAFMVWQDPQKLVEDLLASKEKIIALQAKQIELLEGQLREKMKS